MKIYICHNFGARIELREFVKQLESAGHQVTSSWIIDDSHLFSKNAEQSAVRDLQDLEAASTVIIFLDPFDGGRTGKGKWFEFGYALRAGKRLILVGSDRTCIFCNLPNLRIVFSKEEAISLV